FCLAIERIVRVTVLLGALLFPALIAVCVYEVVARYVFNASTIWAFDITFMVHGALFMLTGAYGLQKKIHVRIDLLSELLPARIQHAIYAAAYLFCFIPAVWLLSDAAIYRSWSAYNTDEVELVSAWGPLVWPFYAALALGLVAMLLQAGVETIRHIVGIVVDGGLQRAARDPERGV
ncbi:MAG: TRAP transporter small permease subunit, partial [Rhodospirillaceae bacterium]